MRIIIKEMATHKKPLLLKNGSIVIDVPRDRNSTFKPVIISKRQRKFNNFDQKVISLYARGMTISDIKAQLQEFYHGAEISESLINQITDDVIEEVKVWQTKPLEKIYRACPKFCVLTIHSELYSEEVEQKIIKKQKPPDTINKVADYFLEVKFEDRAEWI